MLHYGSIRLARFDERTLTTVRDARAWNPACGGCRVVDARNPSTGTSDGQNAFLIAPTRINKLLPMSSDECVTYVSCRPDRGPATTPHDLDNDARATAKTNDPDQ